MASDWFVPPAQRKVVMMPSEPLKVTVDQAMNLQRNFDVMLEDLIREQGD